MYRTVRAWRSTGAPDRTAAATDSPGSLPSITRLGIGEKLLHTYQSLVVVFRLLEGSVRGPVVDCDIVVRLMPDCGSGILWLDLSRF
jgi:hypothetical protein